MAAEVIRVDWGAWGTCGQGVRGLVGVRAFLLRADEDNEPVEGIADVAIDSDGCACPHDNGCRHEPSTPPAPPDPPMLPGMHAWSARTIRDPEQGERR